MKEIKLIDIDLKNVYHSLALAYAKSELESRVEKFSDVITPQEKIQSLYHDYFSAYGYLLKVPKELLEDALAHLEE